MTSKANSPAATSPAPPAAGATADSGADAGTDAEARRLHEDHHGQRAWRRFGPYLSERQWATVREDYSADGTCWEYFPHDQARSRAYRWGEDGLLGICDRKARLCFAFALWNGADPFLKERLYGLTHPQGNHGEDVKEMYFYLDSTPTHSYMRALYKYPQRAFPYEALVEGNRRRTRDDPELELADTGAFDGDRYFDVFAEYAKASPDDILILLTAANRGPDPAPLSVLPTLWFRNTWSWVAAAQGAAPQGIAAQGATAHAGDGDGDGTRPRLAARGPNEIEAAHPALGRYRLTVEAHPQTGEPPPLLFTENETNAQRLFGVPNRGPFVKDAFHAYVVGGDTGAVNPERTGTKAAALYRFMIPPGGELRVRLRLTAVGESAPASATMSGRASEPASAPSTADAGGSSFDQVLAARRAESAAFYRARTEALTSDERLVVRQAYAGLLWSKQFYHYDVSAWLRGDPIGPPPPIERTRGRNAEWRHLFSRDVLSVPDKWEYPWFAAWDLAFHMVPFARIDPNFAKAQLLLMTREWYMNPNGQLPAYEFAFGDVNPPVHAWSAWRTYKLALNADGDRDRAFLERMFGKLLVSFTWWVNRKDQDGRNLFSGGFLGLDNIGVFDRSKPLPTGGTLEQADATAWMAFFSVTMLSMALELAKREPVYEDMASKFFEHFVHIADAMNELGGTGLWDDHDGFYYDRLRLGDSEIPLRVRSLVGLLPLIAVEVLDDEVIDRLPAFKRRMRFFLENRRDLAARVSLATDVGSHAGGRLLLALPTRERLIRVLAPMLDESQFLSAHGIRSLSKAHQQQPYSFVHDGQEFRVEYAPGESRSGTFGGNSNWRGPVWMPINYLLVEALERYHHFYGDGLRVECPTGSGRWLTLAEASQEIAARVSKLFLADASNGGRRPCHGDDRRFAEDPHWRDLVLFHEYFHGEDGRGLGASHQTGWTALVLRFIEDGARRRAKA